MSVNSSVDSVELSKSRDRFLQDSHEIRFDEGRRIPAGPSRDDPKLTDERRELNSLAQYLAGMPAADEHDRLDSSIASRAFRRHSEQVDELFDRFENRYATPLSQWAESSLGKARAAQTVFYPLSGPDFTFADLLYPHAENYILCGLESCEPLSATARLSESKLSNSLPRIAEAISHFLGFSYFITKDLRHDLHHEFLPGVCPVLLVLLARAGCEISSVASFGLRPASDLSASSSEREVPGLYIEFKKHGRRKRLFYFQQHLRDDFFSRESALFRFIKSFAKPAVILKSASYLLHEANFSNIRSLILENSSAVVQDPSSLPYRLLLQHGWNVDLHGNYAGTIPVFRKYEQPDLIEAYRTAQPKRLAFGFSYLTDPRISSLMLATPPR